MVEEKLPPGPEWRGVSACEYRPARQIGRDARRNKDVVRPCPLVDARERRADGWPVDRPRS